MSAVITAEQIAEARTRDCKICQQPPNEPCLNITTGLPYDDGRVHFYRLDAK